MSFKNVAMQSLFFYPSVNLLKRVVVYEHKYIQFFSVFYSILVRPVPRKNIAHL